MPQLGLGTWQASDKAAEQAVLWALEAGYRHIDTASIYENEEAVGNAIKKSGLPREQLFITTKLWNSDHDRAEQALNDSLRRLGLDYVDLYLIHWPAPERLTAWKALESLNAQGKCKAIGVSNFTIRHLTQLLEKSSTVPSVNQVEFSPFNFQKELLNFCKTKGVQMEAYSPLSQANKLDNPLLRSISEKYNKSPAQLMIRWSMQHGLVVIPKSTNQERISQNADIDFQINDNDMQELDNLDEGFRVCPNPETMP